MTDTDKRLEEIRDILEDSLDGLGVRSERHPSDVRTLIGRVDSAAHELLEYTDALRAEAKAARGDTNMQARERDRLSQILAECCVLLGGIKITQDEIPMRIRQIQRKAKVTLEEACRATCYHCASEVPIMYYASWKEWHHPKVVCSAYKIRALMPEGE